jgi:hypothetical protein
MNSTMGPGLILAGQAPILKRPLLVTRPRLEALQASELTAKESSIDAKSDSCDPKTEKQASKLGRWTPLEK